MTIKMPRNLMTAISVVAFAVMLHGCGGGGGGSPATTAPDDTTMDDTTTTPTTTVGQTVPDGTVITVPGVELPDIEVTAVMGQTIPYPGIGTFTCASAVCSVVVADNVITTSGEIVVDAVADDSVDALLYAALNTEPVELNELQTAQAAAADAATGAMTAAGNAATAATAAVDAGENLATLQTGETSSSLATKASEQATLAQAAYMAAMKASEDAAEATDVTTAVEAKVAAEAALANAMAAETMAVKYGKMAMDADDNELIIEGTVKTVGGTSLDAAAGSLVEKVGTGEDEQTTITGLLPDIDQPMHTVMASMGVTGVNGTPDDAIDQYKAPVVGAAERKFPVGKLVDSADDMARLMIVTHYAVTETVKVYASTGAIGQMSHKADTVRLGPGEDGNTGTADDVLADLMPAGTYYRSGTTASIVPDEDGADDAVADDAVGEQVYSYKDSTDDNTVKYVVYHSTTHQKVGDSTYNYSDAVIHVQVDVDGDEDTNNDHEVSAEIPEKAEYKHIHFGVWAALGEAEKSGSQKLSDLGIGFVQNFSDEGLTSTGGGSDDMPNAGKATYNGDWVAAVQAASKSGNGAISLKHNAATLTADFTKATIKAVLDDLATLEGAIAGNTFKGDEATVGTNSLGLTPKAAFTGSFSGGFYGAAAAEAGGVFDFTSKELKAGAFRGAFGGDKE